MKLYFQSINHVCNGLNFIMLNMSFFADAFIDSIIQDATKFEELSVVGKIATVTSGIGLTFLLHIILLHYCSSNKYKYSIEIVIKQKSSQKFESFFVK